METVITQDRDLNRDTLPLRDLETFIHLWRHGKLHVNEALNGFGLCIQHKLEVSDDLRIFIRNLINEGYLSSDGRVLIKFS